MIEPTDGVSQHHLPVVQQHQCGECTLCCKVMRIEEIKKPRGIDCSFVAKKIGCKVYTDRPQGCRDFSCVWLQEAGMPDWARPDRVHGVMSNADNGSFVLHEDPAFPGFASTSLRSMIQEFLKQGPMNFVVVVTGHVRRILAPTKLKEQLEIEHIDEDSFQVNLHG